MARSDEFSAVDAEASPFVAPYSALDDHQLGRHFLAEKKFPDWLCPRPTREHVTRANDIVAGRFTYIGETFNRPTGASWSRNPSKDKEWLIAHHKHYFSVDLCLAWRLTGDQRYLDRWIELTSSFIHNVEPGAIAASDAQVEAKRVESWVLSYLSLRSAARIPPLPGSLVRQFVERLGAEAVYIGGNLRPSRNHRTFQLFAMYLVGLIFPELKASQELRERAEHLLVDNLLNDFDCEGVHIERSTHYHNITLETALAFYELASNANLSIPPELGDRIHLAALFSVHSLLPDGEIPLIGDSDTLDHSGLFETAYRIFRDPVFKWAATRGAEGLPPAHPSRSFGGYFTLTDGCPAGPHGFATRQHIFYDCAPLGEGSHSHYDLFSLCWSAAGRQVIVDPGRYTYLAEPGQDGVDWRHEFKRTRSHNTIEIDGRDQTRYLSKASRPAAGLERYDRTKHKSKHGPAPSVINSAHHQGRLSDWVMATALSNEYHPEHTRALVFMQRQYVVLLDHIHIDDRAAHSCTSRLHLAAEWANRVRLEHRDGIGFAQSEGWTIAVATRDQGTVNWESGWVSKSYGVKEAAPVLAVSIHAASSIDLCTVLMPACASRHRMTLGQVQWSKSADDTHWSVAVDLAIDGQSYRDLFMMAVREDGHLRYGDVDYRGTLIAARFQDGRATHLCGREPVHCRSGAIDLAVRGRHLHWSSES